MEFIRGLEGENESSPNSSLLLVYGGRDNCGNTLSDCWVARTDTFQINHQKSDGNNQETTINILPEEDNAENAISGGNMKFKWIPIKSCSKANRRDHKTVLLRKGGKISVFSVGGLTRYGVYVEDMEMEVPSKYFTRVASNTPKQLEFDRYELVEWKKKFRIARKVPCGLYLTQPEVWGEFVTHPTGCMLSHESIAYNKGLPLEVQKYFH